MKFYEKYTGLLRSWKATYFFYNLLNAGRLKHNKPLYKKYGLKKSIFSSVSAADFDSDENQLPWLDRGDAVAKMEAHADFKTFDKETQEILKTWPERGYVVLPGFFNEKATDQVNQEIGALLQENKVDFNYSGVKLMNAWENSPGTNGIYRDPRLLKVMSFLLGKEVIPFQTISFLNGSQQKAHSDFIHMTTEPKGYLIAAWTALEDIQPGSGELFYYPGSHKLPYVNTSDYDSGNTSTMIGAESYKRYEEKIGKMVQELGLKKETYLPKKGDVLIWHGNLLHGGSPVTDSKLTRKSMVGHYYGKGVICYHEITQRPALMPK